MANRANTLPARSHHGRTKGFSGEVNDLLADGSVHFAFDTIDLATWKALATIHNGEAIQAF